MSNYHLSIKYISRRKGRAAVAAAAYRSGEKLYDRYYGEIYDYTQKCGIFHTEIILPDDAPQEYLDRQTLWNAVEQSEKRHDARLAREIEIALPKELERHEQIKLTREYIKNNFISQGMCADIAIHDKGNGNPHAHILLTTRNIGVYGFAEKNRNWDKRQNATLWRKEWADIQNREYARQGLKIKVSHESYLLQGDKRESTKYRGACVTALERSGISTDRSDENDAIEERNNARKKRTRQREQERNYGRGI